MSSWSIGVQVLGVPVVSTGHFEKNETASAVSVSGDSIAADQVLDGRRGAMSPLDRLLGEPSPLDRFSAASSGRPEDNRSV